MTTSIKTQKTQLALCIGLFMSTLTLISAPCNAQNTVNNSVADTSVTGSIDSLLKDDEPTINECHSLQLADLQKQYDNVSCSYPYFFVSNIFIEEGKNIEGEGGKEKFGVIASISNYHQPPYSDSNLPTFILPIEYDGVSLLDDHPYDTGNLLAVKKRFLGLFNVAQNKFVLPFEYMNINTDFENGVIKGLDSVETTYMDTQFINPDGTLANPKTFYDLDNEFVEERLQVRHDGKYGFLDTRGNEVIPTIYNHASQFKDGKSWVGIRGQWQYRNKLGESIFSDYELVDSYTRSTENKGTSYATIHTNDGKKGVVNGDGEIIIPAIYQSINTDYNSDYIVVVTKNEKDLFSQGKFGMYDVQGNHIIPTEYDALSPFHDEVTLALKGNDTLIIDKNNQVITRINNDETDYYFSGKFYNGLAKVSKDDKYGYVNKYNEIIIPIEFDYAQDFRQSQTSAIKGYQTYIIHSTGEIQPAVDETDLTSVTEMLYHNPYINIVARGMDILILDSQTGKPLASKYTGVLSKQLEGLTMGSIYKSWSNGLLWVKNKAGKHGFINRQGQVVVPIIYDEVDFLTPSGLARVFRYKTDGKQFYREVGLVNSKGEFVIPLGKYDYIGSLSYDERDNSDQLIPVFKNRLAGYATAIETDTLKQGELAIPWQYHSAAGFSHNIAEVGLRTNKKDENGSTIYHYGLIDNQNKLLIPIEYEFIETYTMGPYPEGVIAVRKDGRYGVINWQNEVIIPFEYPDMNDVKLISNGLITVNIAQANNFPTNYDQTTDQTNKRY